MIPKKQLDRSLGPLVRNFLKSYTLVAIGKASTFISSEQNRKQFGKVNVRIVESMIDRPIQDLLQPLLLSSNPSIDKLRVELFDYLRQLSTTDTDVNDAHLIIDDYITFIYDLVGTRSIKSLGDGDGEGEGGVDLIRILDSSPTLENTTNRLLQKIISIEKESQ